MTREASNSAGPTDGALSNDDQFANMFKTPKALLKAPVSQDPPSSRRQLDPRILMAEVKFKSGRRTLPPPPGLQKQDIDSRNVVLCLIQTPTPKVKESPVEVADP